MFKTLTFLIKSKTKLGDNIVFRKKSEGLLAHIIQLN